MYFILVCYFSSYVQRCFILPPHKNVNWVKTKWNTNVIYFFVFFNFRFELLASDIYYFLLLLHIQLSKCCAGMSWFSIKGQLEIFYQSMQYKYWERMLNFLPNTTDWGFKWPLLAAAPQLTRCSPPLCLCSPLYWPRSGPRRPPRPLTDSGSDKTASVLVRHVPHNSRASRYNNCNADFNGQSVRSREEPIRQCSQTNLPVVMS